MTKEEILKYIKYNGTYSKEVKKRLNKLIKKYHPDRNKLDKKTIITLYEVKKELEENKVKTTKKDSSSNIKNNIDKNFILRIINIIKDQIKSTEKNLELIYNDISDINDKIYKEETNLSFLELEIDELNKTKNRLKKHDLLEISCIIVSIIILVTSTYLKNNYILLFLTIPLMTFLSYVYLKKEKIKEIERTLRIKRKSRKNKKATNVDYKTKLNKLEKREIELENEKRRLKNEEAYYEHELSKLNDKTNTKEYENKRKK